MSSEFVILADRGQRIQAQSPDCEAIYGSVRLCSPTGLSGSNSVVESRLPKPLVAGSIPVSRSNTCQWQKLSFSRTAYPLTWGDCWYRGPSTRPRKSGAGSLDFITTTAPKQCRVILSLRRDQDSDEKEPS